MRSKPGLRIAMVAYSEYPFDARIRSEAETLHEAGHDVQVISTRPSVGPSNDRMNGVELHEVALTIRRGGRMRYAYQYAMFFLMSSVLLFKLELERKIDVVHVHTLPDFQVFSALVPKLLGAVLVLDLHEAMPEIMAARFNVSVSSFSFRLACALETASRDFADHLIVANDGIKGAMLRRGAAIDRFTVVYNAGDRFPAAAASKELYDRLRIPPGSWLVHAGSVNKERDVETLVRAIQALVSEFDLRLVVAGQVEPDYLIHLRRVAADLCVTDRIHFVGNLALGDARTLMSRSVLGVVTLERNALTEIAWPIRIAEFTSLGKALLVPRLQFIETVLRDCAHYYEPGDVESLVDGIRYCLRHPTECEAHVVKASEVLRRFSSQETKTALLGLYSQFRTPPTSKHATEGEVPDSGTGSSP